MGWNDKTPNTKLQMFMVSSGYWNKIELLLGRGYNYSILSHRDKNGWNMLMKVAQVDPDMLESLLKNECMVLDNIFTTTDYFIIENIIYQKIKIKLEEHTIRKHRGQTFLHIMCIFSRCHNVLEVVNCISSILSPNVLKEFFLIKDNMGYTFLDYCRLSDNPEYRKIKDIVDEVII